MIIGRLIITADNTDLRGSFFWEKLIAVMKKKSPYALCNKEDADFNSTSVSSFNYNKQARGGINFRRLFFLFRFLWSKWLVKMSYLTVILKIKLKTNIKTVNTSTNLVID